jgi:transposase InsO family protein
MGVCNKLMKSRAAYYKAAKADTVRLEEHELIKSKVYYYRSFMTKLGSKKLFHLIGPELAGHHIKLGRDRFIEFLRKEDLLVPKRRPRYKVTTDSKHSFRVYKNLTQQLKVTKPDQLWVSDITYLRTEKGFCYLALITDVYSRKIVGYDVSDSLELTGALNALRMAQRTKIGEGTIHHSDRGSQYCSYLYTGALKKKKTKISMAAAGNCYENALAERVNGILKMEFQLDYIFKNTQQAKLITKQSISIYNRMRPHWGINLRTPDEMYNLKQKSA